ncbi:MAG: GNAT family N-acetyltransferase [archaeon]|nr:GNAT family N-acetyltransferase [archaeon]
MSISKKEDLYKPDIEGLYIVKPEDLDKATKALGRAFRKDPVMCDLLKDCPEKFEYIFATPLKMGLKYGVVYAPSPNLEAISVWMGPEKVNPGMWSSFFWSIYSGVLVNGMKLGYKLLKKISKDSAPLEKDRKKNISLPYFYLNLLGVDTEHQGKGIGSKLISTFIKNAPNEVPFYVETETESNVRFYERLGFKVIKEIRLPSSNLPMWELKHNGN